MVMGYGANAAVIINEEDVRKVIPEEFQKMDDVLEIYQVSIAELAVAGAMEDSIDEVEESTSDEIMAVWEKAQEAFKKETGLSLFIGHHDQTDEGDRYDDVDGVFFSLNFEEVYGYSPEAMKLSNNGISLMFTQWVSHG